MKKGIIILLLLSAYFCYGKSVPEQYPIPAVLEDRFPNIYLGMKLNKIEDKFTYDSSINSYIIEKKNLTIYLFVKYRTIVKIKYEFYFDYNNYNLMNDYYYSFTQTYDSPDLVELKGVLLNTSIEINKVTWYEEKYKIKLTFPSVDNVKKAINDTKIKTLPICFSSTYEY